MLRNVNTEYSTYTFFFYIWLYNLYQSGQFNRKSVSYANYIYIYIYIIQCHTDILCTRLISWMMILPSLIWNVLEAYAVPFIYIYMFLNKRSFDINREGLMKLVYYRLATLKGWWYPRNFAFILGWISRLGPELRTCHEHITDLTVWVKYCFREPALSIKLCVLIPDFKLRTFPVLLNWVGKHVTSETYT